MPPPLPPAARERRRAATRVLERALLALVLWRLGGALGAALSPAPRGSGPPPPLRIDLARDPPWRLRSLPGVGRARAEALVEDRARNGPPQRLEDLLRIPGIGPLRLEAWRAARDVHVVLDGAPLAPPPPEAGTPTVIPARDPGSPH